MSTTRRTPRNTWAMFQLRAMVEGSEVVRLLLALPPVGAVGWELSFDSRESCVLLFAFAGGASGSSPSARMVSSLDSTPATACWSSEPHLEAGFDTLGALLMVRAFQESRRLVCGWSRSWPPGLILGGISMFLLEQGLCGSSMYRLQRSQ